jgi:hypothetical protein
MVEWDPRDVMGTIQYAKFKIGMWVEVDPPPSWVSNAADDYYRDYCDDYGHRPYDEEKAFIGHSLKYKVEYRNQGEYGRKIRRIYYAKIK